MKTILITTALLFLTGPSFASVEKLDTGDMPKITLSKSDSLLIEDYLKKKKDRPEAVIVNMVCMLKRKKYVCSPLKMESPKK